jgi:hypothetical protein
MVHNDHVAARSASQTDDMDNMNFEDMQAKENDIDDDCDKNPESDCNPGDALAGIHQLHSRNRNVNCLDEHYKLQDNALAQLKNDPAEVEYDKENVGGPFQRMTFWGQHSFRS